MSSELNPIENIDDMGDDLKLKDDDDDDLSLLDGENLADFLFFKTQGLKLDGNFVIMGDKRIHIIDWLLEEDSDSELQEPTPATEEKKEEEKKDK
jgi:hypothetical protein